MIRAYARSVLLLAAIAAAASPLHAAPRAKPAPADDDAPASGRGSHTAAKGKTPDGKGGPDVGKGKSVQIASAGDWRGFLAQSGKDKTCYALASPKDREPTTLKRDPAYLFISNRPAENVRNEISIMLGFPVKDGGDAHAELAGANYDLIAKGTNAWIKNPADEGRFLDAMKRGGRLVVKAPSSKGALTTDSYTLTGLKQVLDKVQKECL